MPRLNHKKARTGCQRCKARKVKCDESRPKCLACTRHNVPCEYVEPQPRRSDGHQASPQTPGYGAGQTGTNQFAAIHGPALAGELTLELRLMREWTLDISQTFAVDVDFWQKQATDLGLEDGNRMILDAMFSLSALHQSWPPSQLVADDQAAGGPNHSGASRRDMIIHAQRYLQRALDGHSAAMSNLSKDNVKATYTASVLLLYYSFFNLGEIAYEPSLPGYDHTFWTRLSGHTHYLCQRWQTMDDGERIMIEWGVTFGRSSLKEVEELFGNEQGKPFTELLTFAEEYEANFTDDKAVYQQGVAYLAFIHKSIVESNASPLINCQRLIAMPSQLGGRFNELVEHRQPRALLLLAHIFAMTKLLSDQVPWLRGIAERQAPPIQQQIPPAWQEMLRWPMETTFGSQPESTDEHRNDQALREMLQFQPEEKDQS